MSEPDRTWAAKGREGQIETGPLLAATTHWLTGVVFAVILGGFLIFVAPNIPGLAPALDEIQDKGVDLSMKERVRARGLANLTLPPDVTGYVFIDIDPDACDAAKLGARCLSRSPAEPGLTARVARGVLDGDPRVVIIDAALWDIDPGEATPDHDFGALVKHARDHPGSPVIAAAPFRPTKEFDTGVLEWDLVPRSLRGGAVRFAPALLWRDPGELDDVVRSYSPFANLESTSGAKQPVPTLPMLAALYAETGGDLAKIRSVDCRYGPQIGVPVTRCGAQAADPVLDRASVARRKGRIVFTLPPKDSPTAKVFTRAPTSIQDRYNVYSASQAFAPDGGLLIDRGKLTGKIVVISTSAPTALDLHATPLGPMSGAELVLNAVAALLNTHGLIAGPSDAQLAWHEAQIIAAASLPFLVFWLGYCWLARALRSRRSGALILGLYGAVGFILAIGAATVVAAAITLEGVERGLANGFAAEFFSPILALSLEGFAEGARRLVDRIEMGVNRLVGFTRLRRQA